MMKKTISFLLAAVLLFSALVPVSAAEGVDPTIRMHLRSDLDGMKPADYTMFAEIDSDAMDFNTVTRSNPVSVSDYSGTPLMDTDELKAGREYVIYYDLYPKDGFVLPQTKEELDIRFDCDKGVRVIHYNITRGSGDHRMVNIMAVVIVDGNLFQRIIGWIYDRYIKARAWSLY